MLKVSALIILFLIPLVFTNKVNACDPKTEVCPISADNYDASKHTNITIINMINTLGCLGEDFSITGQGCANYAFKAGSRTSPSLISYPYNPSGGALGTAVAGMAYLYTNPPASGIGYVAQSFQNFGLVKPAYAQVFGSGYGVIQPVETLWKIMRNIAFLGFIVITIIAGVMIMLRKQLDQRTVVGIQQALPGIVVALILTYFSFFIAGLVIDFAFVGSRVAGSVIIAGLPQAAAAPGGAPVAPRDAASIVDTVLNGQNVFNMFMQFIALPGVTEISGAFSGILGSGPARIGLTLAGALSLLLTCLPAIAIPGAGPVIVGGCAVVGGGAGAFAQELVPALIYIVLLFGLLQAMFRVFFALIEAFVTIVLNTIFGPLIILSSAIPGNNGAFTNWIRGLFANVLIFPAIFTMFVLVAALLNYADPWQLNGAVPANAFRPLPLFGNTSTGFIQFILAYGILLAMPGIPDFIKRSLKAEGPREVATAIKQGIGTGTGAVGTIVSFPGRIIKAKPWVH